MAPPSQRLPGSFTDYSLAAGADAAGADGAAAAGGVSERGCEGAGFLAAAFGAAVCAGSAGFAGTEDVAGSGAMMLIGGIDAELGKSPDTGLPVGRSGSDGMRAADGTGAAG